LPAKRTNGKEFKILTTEEIHGYGKRLTIGTVSISEMSKKDTKGAIPAFATLPPTEAQKAQSGSPAYRLKTNTSQSKMDHCKGILSALELLKD
jgi:hypothetical protein